MNLREKIGELLGLHTAEQISAELASLRIDTALRTLTDQGFLGGDSGTQAVARKLAEHDLESLTTLLRSPKAMPAQNTTIVQPSAPEDPIAALAAEKKIAYHEAASLYQAEGLITHA